MLELLLMTLFAGAAGTVMAADTSDTSADTEDDTPPPSDPLSAVQSLLDYAAVERGFVDAPTTDEAELGGGSDSDTGNDTGTGADTGGTDPTNGETGGDGDVVGQALTFDGSEVLNGTEGDDTLAETQDAEAAPNVVNLLGGDDQATVALPFGIEVNGGDGADTLTSTAVGNTLNGGEGDDRLSGIDAVNMSGGAGNDTILFDSDVELNDSVALIDGGAGDDRIGIFADAGVDAPDRGGAIVTGGEGADQFAIELELQNSTVEIGAEDGQLESRVVRIDDFDPSEDMLGIQIERLPGTEDRPVVIGFDQVEVDGVFTTELTLNFTAVDGGLAAQSTITVISNAAFSQGDVTILGV